MGKTMTASGMTDGQIDNIVDKLRAALRKHRSELSSEATQLVLGVENLGMELFAIVREHAEHFSDMIVRCVKVDRTRTPQEALTAIGRKQYVTDSVVKTMPNGDGDEAELYFFIVGRWIGDDDLEKEYEKRGLKATDPYSLAAVNEADPAFADERPNCTHWKGADGKWYYIAFHRWRGERYVSVGRSDGDWGDDWWFAGVRK